MYMCVCDIGVLWKYLFYDGYAMFSTYTVCDVSNVYHVWCEYDMHDKKFIR